MLTDLRYSIRALLKTPGFTTIAVVVLALAIGGNTAMFSIVNALALRPLAVQAPAALVGLYSKDRKPEGGYRGFSYPDYLEIRQRNPAFSSVLAHQVTMVGVTEGEATRRAFASLVSANYFATFGVKPALGRDFLPEEERPGAAAPVVIVSHSYWRQTGFDPGLVSRPIRVNGQTLTVVGVAPEHFTGTAAMFSPEFWVPLGSQEMVALQSFGEARRSLLDRGYRPLMLVGRLKPGLDAAAAQQQLEPLASQLEQEFPKENQDQVFIVSKLPRLSISTNPKGGENPAVLTVLLLSMSGVVLLIACLNLANMLLARGAARRREIAVRLALGGGRARIIRQLLTEGLLLAGLGGAAGLLLAQGAMNLLISSLAPRLPFMTVVFPSTPDFRVLAVSFAFCVVATVLFGLGPALRLSRTDILSDLKEQTGTDPGFGAGTRWFGLRNLLVIAQIALSLVLLTAAGLFTRGALKAASATPGFRLENGLLVELDAQLGGIEEPQGRQLYAQLLERTRALPGVESASLGHIVPFGLFSDGRNLLPAGAAGPAGQPSADTKPTYAQLNLISTEYFKTLGLPLLRGREFDRLETSDAQAARVVIIDEPLATKLWPGEDPIGRHVQIAGATEGPDTNAMQVVGLVPGLRQELMDKEPQAHFYVPFGQHYRPMMHLHVKLADRGPGAEVAMLRTLRQEIHALNGQLPVLSSQTLRTFRDEGLLLWFVRTGARIFMVFGGLALFLALVGVYGVKAYLVTRRTREIGIRIALGATTRDVLWDVLRSGLVLTGVGLGVGLLLALPVGLLLRSMLYEVKGLDPLTFTLMPILLALAALLACYVPARRAARIDPMKALRYE